MSGRCEPWSTELLVDDLLDAIAVPAWLHCGERPLRGNRALRRLCGLTPVALRRTAHVAMVALEDRPALAAATVECLLGSGEPPAHAAHLLTRDGGRREVELTLRRVHWGGLAMALVTCIDHSDIQHVQNSLQAMSGLLRQIVDGAPVASFVMDRAHRVTHWTHIPRIESVNRPEFPPRRKAASGKSEVG